MKRWIAPLLMITLGMACATLGPAPRVTPPPVDPPRAVAVIVQHDHAPVVGARVVLDDRPDAHVGITDANGYVLFPVVPAALTDSHLWVTAEGMNLYDAHADIGQGNFTLTVTLTAAQPPPPPYDPRVVMADFCNLKDARGRVMFTSVLAALPVAEQEEWIDILTRGPATHIVLSIESGYPGYAPTVNFYTSGRMAEWLQTLDRVLAAKNSLGQPITPVVFLHSGDGFPGLDYFRGVLAQIPSSYYTRVVWVSAWESVAGGYSSRQFRDSNDEIRALLGPAPLLAAHLSPGRLSFSSNPGEPDDPWRRWCVNVGPHNDYCYPGMGDAADRDRAEHPEGFWAGDEMACYRTGWGADRKQPHPFDVLLWQSDAIRPGTVFDVNDGPMGRAKEVIDRVVGGRPPAPDWFAGLPKRPVPVAYETVAYYQIRGQGDSAYAREVATFLKGLGFVGFGNGLPY